MPHCRNNTLFGTKKNTCSTNESDSKGRTYFIGLSTHFNWMTVFY